MSCYFEYSNLRFLEQWILDMFYYKIIIQMFFFLLNSRKSHKEKRKKKKLTVFLSPHKQSQSTEVIIHYQKPLSCGGTEGHLSYGNGVLSSMITPDLLSVLK